MRFFYNIVHIEKRILRFLNTHFYFLFQILALFFFSNLINVTCLHCYNDRGLICSYIVRIRMDIYEFSMGSIVKWLSGFI